LKQAVTQGILSQSELDQAVEHDLVLKLQMHLIPMPEGASPVPPKTPVGAEMIQDATAELPRTRD
jgi:hypothetical protein